MKAKFIFLYGSSIYIGLTPIFSVYFSMLGLPIPAYLFASLLTISLIGISIALNGIIFTRKIHAALFFIVVSIFAYALSFIQNHESAAAAEKIFNLVYVVFLPILLLTVAVLATRAEYGVDSVNRIYWRVFGFSTIALLIAFFLFKTPETEGRYVLPGLDNPIWVSRHLAAGFLVYFVQAHSAQKSNLSRQTLFATVTFGALILSGSRAPLIAAIICLFFYLYGRGKLSIRVLVASILSLSLILIAFGVLTNSYVFDTDFYSVYHRLDAVQFVLDYPFSFFGNGISSFGHYYLGEDVDIYPHNLLAELYFELGMIGISLFLVITWVVFKTFAHSIPGLLALFYYINAMSSGDVPGNAPLFISLLVAWIVYKSDNAKHLYGWNRRA